MYVVAKITKLTSIVVVTAVLLFVPLVVFGADPLVPCDGTNCQFCHLAELANRILNWFFGLVFVLFGVMVFISGFGLVTSGGNQSKLDEAKKNMSNAFIGLLIVFSAWLIVDTLLKALLPENAAGETEVILGGQSFGPWNSISCGD